jgi:hypothetical protein
MKTKTILQTAVTILLATAAIIRAGSCYPAQTTNNINNPHKGFMLWGTDYADGAPDNFYGSTIFHIYIPWREVETSDQVFDWNGFEAHHLQPILNDYPNATFVLRLVADYPDGPGSGIALFYGGVQPNRDFPAFLTNLNITAWEYTSCDGDGPGITPDWNNSQMITQMVQLVSAFADRYDGDPHITAVQAGLLGLWGEWHQSGCPDHAPLDAAKSAVRDAYANTFTNTPIQTRYPRTPDAVGVEFGFHEDFFPSFTGEDIYGFPEADDSGDWNMYYCFMHETPASTNNWQSSPISGESPLNSQKQTWTDDFDDIITVIKKYHFSFLGPAGGHDTDGHQTKFNVIKRNLGYNLSIRHCQWPDVITNTQPFQISLAISNSGSAPCYHEFPIEIAICKTNGISLWHKHFKSSIKTILPGETNSCTESFVTGDIPQGTYSLRIGIIDPRTAQPGIRLQTAGEDSLLRYPMGAISIKKAHGFSLKVVQRQPNPRNL